MIITFSGPDGSGKSTLISMLTKHFDAEGINYTYIHFYPTTKDFFAPFSSNVLLSTSQLPYTKGPYMSPIGIIKYLMILGITYLYNLFFFLSKPSSSIVIYDRCAYDLLLDPERSRIHLPSFFQPILFKMLPNYDISYFLLANVSTIRSRKNEQSIQKITSINCRYVNLLSRIRNVVPLDTDSSSPSQCIKRILDDIAASTKKR